MISFKILITTIVIFFISRNNAVKDFNLYLKCKDDLEHIGFHDTFGFRCYVFAKSFDSRIDFIKYAISILFPDTNTNVEPIDHGTDNEMGTTTNSVPDVPEYIYNYYDEIILVKENGSKLSTPEQYCEYICKENPSVVKKIATILKITKNFTVEDCISKIIYFILNIN
ncbi:uncharacterized protein LOC113558648 isoform X2 [Rhopalosiphum maidis]|uniref:uncharacterized protein LOC113558648 isoform X2 n=1 Tax=Rhopalosiphum maidis TaxID=43146 RepID=UPI000EFFB8AA|nr:uncharacterized protein LOC113558648 isoform X2 [Rhopalosiphum maidis]